MLAEPYSAVSLVLAVLVLSPPQIIKGPLVSPAPAYPNSEPPYQGGYVLGVVGVTVTIPASRYIAPEPNFAPALPITSLTPKWVTAVRITSVLPGSAASAAGLSPGDTILTAGETSVSDIESLRRAIANAGDVLEMTVLSASGSLRTSYAHLGGYINAQPQPEAPSKLLPPPTVYPTVPKLQE